MGMGFPMGMRISWESHGNGNKTQKWEWDGREWETRSMGMEIAWPAMGMHSHRNMLLIAANGHLLMFFYN